MTTELTTDDALLASWVGDVAALAPRGDPDSARSSGVELLARWDEPPRRYHTRQHLIEMLAATDTLAASIGLGPRERRIARVAAWLHDAVYDVRTDPGDSERASAQLARNLLISLGVGAAEVELVEQLILLTIDHGTQLSGDVAAVFSDADLAILAAPHERFDEYCAQVRAEYAHVPAASYAEARSAILRDLVERPEVYRTAYARAAWTVAARSNVAGEISRLV
ncbi:HD domain-containing protein [Flexivirga caeni]|uniref:HD domain-containing protein n=1 Tax=Flexivirga caeni TaxID=2294115 RepID=UPI0013152F7A|nr:HD domain-containing protein [Flexivirga caeni]